MLKEYKQKYQEFQKATKYSKQNQRKFAKDVQQLAVHQKQLEADHATLAANLDIAGEPEEISDLIKEKQDEINQRETEWDSEKAELLA